MTEDRSNTAIVKVDAASLARYSNALVKRAVEEIALRLPETLQAVTQAKRILIIGAEVGEVLAQMLPSEGYQTKFIEAYGEPLPRTHIFSELSIGKYDMVLISYWSSFEVLLDIRNRFPTIKTLFLNSYKYEWDAIAKQRGVDAVIRVPFDQDELLDVIRDVMSS